MVGGEGTDAALGSFGALRGPLGGGAGCLGYWRREAAPAADLTGFDAAEPIEDDEMWNSKVLVEGVFCGALSGGPEGDLAFDLDVRVFCQLNGQDFLGSRVYESHELILLQGVKISKDDRNSYGY